jgi:hypothetical protein
LHAAVSLSKAAENALKSRVAIADYIDHFANRNILIIRNEVLHVGEHFLEFAN